jgi:hypothetical protein
MIYLIVYKCSMMVIPLKELVSTFHLPIHKASWKLGCSITIIKLSCRQYGITRWPQRVIKSWMKMLFIMGLCLKSKEGPEYYDNIIKYIKYFRGNLEYFYAHPEIIPRYKKKLATLCCQKAVLCNVSCNPEKAHPYDFSLFCDNISVGNYLLPILEPVSDQEPYAALLLAAWEII